MDGLGSTRRGDDQTHPTSSSQAASRHEQQLTSLEADRSYVFFLEVGHHGLIGIGPSQPGLAPALRSRHRDDVSTGDTMGCPPSRVEDPTRQDRKRRQCPSDSRDGSLDHADSAQMDLYRMECGAKESFASVLSELNPVFCERVSKVFTHVGKFCLAATTVEDVHEIVNEVMSDALKDEDRHALGLFTDGV